jgi:phosphate transport system protein
MMKPGDEAKEAKALAMAEFECDNIETLSNAPGGAVKSDKPRIGDTEMITHHDQELSLLKDKLLTMASMTEASITQAVKALIERDDEMARQVKSQDDQIDRLEIEMDEMAIMLLSKAPLARDLRFIIVAMKISHDLERSGDEAWAIAKRAIKLNQEPQLKPYVDIPRMATMALDMIRCALEAFVNRESKELARTVLQRDEEVNSLYKQLQRELVSYMLESPPNITRCLHLMQVAKRIERIADHATNIAEEVIYLHEGQDVRHRQS